MLDISGSSGLCLLGQLPASVRASWTLQAWLPSAGDKGSESDGCRSSREHTELQRYLSRSLLLLNCGKALNAYPDTQINTHAQTL